MTTTELQIVTDETVEEDLYDPENVCHLYDLEPVGVAICGKRVTTHGPFPFTPGPVTCPKCGRPLCMECVLINRGRGETNG